MTRPGDALVPCARLSLGFEPWWRGVAVDSASLTPSADRGDEAFDLERPAGLVRENAERNPKARYTTRFIGIPFITGSVPAAIPQ